MLGCARIICLKKGGTALKELFSIDLKDYNPNDSVFRRPSARAIIVKNTIFEQENYYFWCECEEKVVDQNLDDYEKEAEFALRYVDIDEAIKVNSEYRSDDFFNEIMIRREKKVLEMIKAKL